MIASLRLLSVALVPVFGIRLQTPDNHKGNTMAASFGGGGCLSFLSQIGYLRGLLADDLGGGEGVTLTTLASSSGGSWAVGGLFDKLANTNATKRNGLANIADIFEQKEDKKWDGNELGRWCMYPQLHKKKDPADWNPQMMECGDCASKPKYHPQGCTAKSFANDTFLHTHIFGVAAECVEKFSTEKELQIAEALASSSKERPPWEAVLYQASKEFDANVKLQQSGFEIMGNISGKFKDNPGRYASYPLPLDGKDVPVLGPALSMHGHFLPKDEKRKLSDIANVFSNAAGDKTHWSVFWTALTPAGTVTRGSSGSAATSDYNMGEAMYMSSDAISASMAGSQIWSAINDPDPTKCFAYANMIQTQTLHKKYPWPFETAPGLPPLQFASDWRRAGVDGAIMDNNAVGEAVRLMDSLPEEERPKSLTSLLTGSFLGSPKDTDIDIDNVISYFKENVTWRSLFAPITAVLPKVQKECRAVLDRKVKNPNHLFKIDGLVGVSGHESCNESVMLSRFHNETCYNFAYQADTTGSVFVREAEVIKNTFWGIKGDWKHRLTIVFTILDSNPASDHWKQDVYKDDTMALKRLQRFPSLIGLAETANPLEKLSPFQAFALMNYNSYKGYMSHCALLHYQSNGEKQCKYCDGKKGGHPERCEKWLPFLSK